MLRRLLKLGCIVLVLLAIFVIAVNYLLIDDNLANCKAPTKDNANCQPADVIVAVSGGDTTARAKKAIELYKAGWAKEIIFSGDSADPESISNAMAMREIALAEGVPSADIHVEEKSRDTRENAKNTVKILDEMGAKRVILVSSPYHLRRVKLNFLATDGQIEYRTAAANDDNWRKGSWFLTIKGWSITLTELAGLTELGVNK